jgi:hypothetical protein
MGVSVWMLIDLLAYNFKSIHEILFHVFVVFAVKLAGARSNSAVVYASDNHLLKCDLIIQGRNPIHDGQMHLVVWRSFYLRVPSLHTRWSVVSPLWRYSYLRLSDWIRPESIHQMARGSQELGHNCRWHVISIFFKLVSSSQLYQIYTKFGS